MKFLPISLGLILLCLNIRAQDCFSPPSGSTLYTTDLPAYDPPAISGFISTGPTQSGSWSVNSTAGDANLVFSDFTGRTTTFSITGTGSVVIDNISTDITTNAMTSCQHTFTERNLTLRIIQQINP